MAEPSGARVDLSTPVPDPATLGHVHLVAIGGSGMSGVARLLLARGLVVSGSDAQDSATLRALADEGATVHVGHDAAHLDGVDTVVVSSAIREDNPEVAAARSRGLRVLHRSQALAAAATGVRAVAVAGANGKTTTTSMIAVALAAAGLDPSFASGSAVPGWETNAHAGQGDAFVIEADESDGSFLVYRPDIAVVTNVQPDHLDFYGTFEQVKAAYRSFAASRRPGGLLVACLDDAGSRELAVADAASGGRVLTYGFDAGADVHLSDPVAAARDDAGFSARATVRLRGAGTQTLRVAAPGLHNLLDAAAAYAVAVSGFGADPGSVLAALADFSGARRRFEVVGTVRGVTVVDDYAHNAGKVAALLSTAVRLVGADRVHVVFQPHLYSRTRDFADGFGAALAEADDVVLLEVYGAREGPIPGVTSALVADAVRAHNPRARVEVASDPGSVPAGLAARARAGDLVLVVGAGDVTRLAPRVVEELGRST